MPERTRQQASDVIRIIQLDASAKSEPAGRKRARQGGACNACWLGVVAASVCVRMCVAQQMKCASVVAERESNAP